MSQPLKKLQAWINLWKQTIKESVQAATKLLPGQKQLLEYYKTETDKTPTTTVNRERLKQQEKEVRRKEAKRKATKVKQYFKTEGRVRSTNRVTFAAQTVHRIQQSIQTAFQKLVTPRASFDDRSDDSPT